MAHVGFTPQSEHTLGGYRVQGRGEAADKVLRDAQTMQDAMGNIRMAYVGVKAQTGPSTPGD